MTKVLWNRICFTLTLRAGAKSTLFSSTLPRMSSRSFRLKTVSVLSPIYIKPSPLTTTPPPPYPILSHLGKKKTVRRALVEAPENVATLVRVITSRLFNLVSDHTFPSSAPPSYVPSFASSLIKGVGVGVGVAAEQRNATKEVLNCLRVLQRVLPVVFELESEPGVFEREVLWRRDVVAAEEHAGQGQGQGQGEDRRRHSERTEQTPQFVIEDDEDENDAVENATPVSSPQIPSSSSASSSLSPKQATTTTTTLPSVAERLFGCLVDLLFCCGFTLPTKLQVDHYKINHVIW